MTINTEVAEILRTNRDSIAETIVDGQISGMAFTYTQKQASLKDAKSNIDYLANAIEIESIANFNSYILWLRDILRSYNFQDSLLIDHLNRLNEYVRCHFSEAVSTVVKGYIDESISSILTENGVAISYLEASGEFKTLAQQYFKALLAMNKIEAVTLILNYNERYGISIKDLYLNVFTNVLYEIGRQWALRNITVGQEHFATAVTVYVMSLLNDKSFNREKKAQKMIGICVEDELHEIGIRMVCDIFEFSKWDTYYLGANVPMDSVLSEVKRLKADVLVISVTLAIKVPVCKALIALIKKECPDVNIIVGGHPFNTDANLWRFVGADGYSSDAYEAVEIASNLVEV